MQSEKVARYYGEYLFVDERVLKQCGMLVVTEPDDMSSSFLGEGTEWCCV